MYIVNLVFGLFFVLMGCFIIWISTINRPIKTAWPFLGSGKYTTTTNYVDGKITIKDVYGKVVGEAKMEPKP